MDSLTRKNLLLDANINHLASLVEELQALYVVLATILTAILDYTVMWIFYDTADSMNG